MRAKTRKRIEALEELVLPIPFAPPGSLPDVVRDVRGCNAMLATAFDRLHAVEKSVKALDAAVGPEPQPDGLLDWRLFAYHPDARPRGLRERVEKLEKNFQRLMAALDLKFSSTPAETKIVKRTTSKARA